MTKVRCINCGNVQDTYGKWFFKCNSCGFKQTIENSIYEPETSTPSSVNSMPSKSISNTHLTDDGTSNSLDEFKSSEKKKPKVEEASISPSTEVLEIDDNTPKEAPQKEKKKKIEETPKEEKKYQCEACGFKFDELNDGRCPSCNQQLI